MHFSVAEHPFYFSRITELYLHWSKAGGDFFFFDNLQPIPEREEFYKRTTELGQWENNLDFLSGVFY